MRVRLQPAQHCVSQVIPKEDSISMRTAVDHRKLRGVRMLQPTTISLTASVARAHHSNAQPLTRIPITGCAHEPFKRCIWVLRSP